jgi:hypothetical protein
MNASPVGAIGSAHRSQLPFIINPTFLSTIAPKR